MLCPRLQTAHVLFLSGAFWHPCLAIHDPHLLLLRGVRTELSASASILTGITDLLCSFFLFLPVARQVFLTSEKIGLGSKKRDVKPCRRARKHFARARFADGTVVAPISNQ